MASDTAAAGASPRARHGGPVGIVKWTKRHEFGCRHQCGDAGRFGHEADGDQGATADERRLIKAAEFRAIGEDFGTMARGAENAALVEEAARLPYIAWNAGSILPGPILAGSGEVVRAIVTAPAAPAHIINAHYRRGCVNPVLDEVKEAKDLLKAHPNIWSRGVREPDEDFTSG